MFIYFLHDCILSPDIAALGSSVFYLGHLKNRNEISLFPNDASLNPASTLLLCGEVSVPLASSLRHSCASLCPWDPAHGGAQALPGPPSGIFGEVSQLWRLHILKELQNVLPRVFNSPPFPGIIPYLENSPGHFPHLPKRNLRENPGSGQLHPHEWILL